MNSDDFKTKVSTSCEELNLHYNDQFGAQCVLIKQNMETRQGFMMFGDACGGKTSGKFNIEKKKKTP